MILDRYEKILYEMYILLSLSRWLFRAEFKVRFSSQLEVIDLIWPFYQVNALFLRFGFIVGIILVSFLLMSKKHTLVVRISGVRSHRLAWHRDWRGWPPLDRLNALHELPKNLFRLYIKITVIKKKYICMYNLLSSLRKGLVK